MPKPERVSIQVSIRKDLAERLDTEADSRVVGKALLVEKALEGLFDAFDGQAQTAVPGPPPGE